MSDESYAEAGEAVEESVDEMAEETTEADQPTAETAVSLADFPQAYNLPAATLLQSPPPRPPQAAPT